MDALFVIIPQVVAEYYNVMLRNKQTDNWIQSNLRAMFARTRLQAANANVVIQVSDRPCCVFHSFNKACRLRGY
jgi:hypothetical protein